MRLSENKLLDGFNSITKYGGANISMVDGRQIWWVYRNNDGCVSGRDCADYITIEQRQYQPFHFLQIQLARKLTKNQVLQLDKSEDMYNDICALNMLT